MANPQDILHHILERIKAGTATPEDCHQLLEMVNGDEGAATVSRINDLYERQGLAFLQDGDPKWKEMLHQIVAVDKEAPASGIRRMRVWHWVAAACCIALLGTGIYYYHHHDGNKQPPVVANTLKDIPAPAANRAMITLADGSQVFLDSAGNGQLARQGNVQLVKLADGQVAYRAADGSMSGGEAYNTLTNPRGSKVIDMTLSDGSHVWLNAGSSITYPVAFTGDERKVSMTGEAYFEIVPRSLGSGSRSLSGTGEVKKPFIVEKGDMQVTVLGTHFNINAYDDENDIKVTLLEGAVKVSLPSPSGEGPDRYREGVRPEVKLKPGQQAQLKNHENHSITKIMVQTVDLEQVMAWKNGIFNFSARDIRAIMREIGRWYDVQVEYKGALPEDLFSGIIRRDNNVSQVLKMLEQTGRVSFSIRDKTIIVTR